MMTILGITIAAIYISAFALAVCAILLAASYDNAHRRRRQ